MKKTIVFRVSGRVQGVFFRMAAKEQADFHGLTGWVRNRPDGSVAGRVTGEQGPLEEFRVWLSHGPSAAHVTDLEWEEVPLEEFAGFEIH